jgi:tRNA(Arg) A34 adenosine deaminase TadA
MLQISRNLQTKLGQIGINNLDELMAIGYLEAFSRLRLVSSGISFKELFLLYSLIKQIEYKNLTEDLKSGLIKEFRELPPRHKPLPPETINNYLAIAEELAYQAKSASEIPIGALIVENNQIIGRGFNQTRSHNDILAHAEIQAIREAQDFKQNFRLNDCDLYVTIEPCLMCSGAIINSRIRRLIFGAREPKTGACVSQFQIFNNSNVNHHCEIIGPVDQNKYSQLLSEFFQFK